MCIPLMYRKAYMQDTEKAHRGVIASRIKVQRADAYALSHRSLRPLMDNLFDYPGVIVMNGAWHTPSTICSQ